MASIRSILGFAFVYLASTSLFRIYPQTLSFKKNVSTELSPQELLAAHSVERLLTLDKVYQEPAYGRSQLAAEVGVTEAALSRIVNIYFEKTVPNLLNGYRVEDAKRLLLETKEDLAVISRESGFNSLSTFNRYFKELEGVSPSTFRKEAKR